MRSEQAWFSVQAKGRYVHLYAIGASLYAFLSLCSNFVCNTFLRYTILQKKNLDSQPKRKISPVRETQLIVAFSTEAWALLGHRTVLEASHVSHVHRCRRQNVKRASCCPQTQHPPAQNYPSAPFQFAAWLWPRRVRVCGAPPEREWPLLGCVPRRFFFYHALGAKQWWVKRCLNHFFLPCTGK